MSLDLYTGGKLVSSTTRVGNDGSWQSGRSWDRRSAVVHRPSLHSRYRFAAADPGPLIRRALLDVRAVNSSILERNSLRTGEVFALL
jgi:hypothetical protein